MTKVDILSETASDSLQPTAKINNVISSEVREYFEKLRDFIVNKDEYDFVVDLDDVWRFVYTRRFDAVKYLTSNFSEGIDYEVKRQTPSQNNLPKKKYYLTVRAMENFIVRKNAEIFEIYRRIFHWVLEGSQPKQVINVVTIGIENDVNLIENKENQSYPAGYDSIKQILKSLGYKHIKPKQLFKILVERGLLKEIKKKIIIEKDVSIVYSDGEELASGMILNRNRIDSNTIRNQLIFRKTDAIELLDKAGVSLSNEEYLSRLYKD